MPRGANPLQPAPGKPLEAPHRVDPRATLGVHDLDVEPILLTPIEDLANRMPLGHPVEVVHTAQAPDGQHVDAIPIADDAAVRANLDSTLKQRLDLLGGGVRKGVAARTRASENVEPKEGLLPLGLGPPQAAARGLGAPSTLSVP